VGITPRDKHNPLEESGNIRTLFHQWVSAFDEEPPILPSKTQQFWISLSAQNRSFMPNKLQFTPEKTFRYSYLICKTLEIKIFNAAYHKKTKSDRLCKKNTILRKNQT